MLFIVSQHEGIAEICFHFLFDYFIYSFQTVVIGSRTVKPAVVATVEWLTAMWAQGRGSDTHQRINGCMAMVAGFHR